MTGFGSVATMALTTLAGVAVARGGGPRGYAVFVAANMLVFVSSVLFACSLPLALARHVARVEEEAEQSRAAGNQAEGGAARREAVRRIASASLCLTSLVALASGAVIGLSLPRLEAHLQLVIGAGFAPAFPLVLLGAMVADCAIGVYLGLLRPRAVLAITASGPLLMLLYVLLRRVVPELPLWGAVAASYGGSGIVAVVQLWRDRLLGGPLPPRAMRLVLRPVSRGMAPALAFTYFTIFSAWSDRWIVGTQLGAVPFGLYAAVAAIIQAALRVPTNIAIMLVPASAKVALHGAAQSARFNQAAVSAFGLFAALMIVVLLLAGPLIVRLLFGPGFAPAAPALLLMTPSLAAAAISIPLLSALTGASQSGASQSGAVRQPAFLWLGLTIPARILLLLLLAPRWGLSGAACATALADALLAAVCVFVARRVGMPFPLGALARPAGIGLLAYAPGAALLALGVHPLVAAAVALAVFTPALWRAARPLSSRPASSSSASSAHRAFDGR